ncbi:MULTISPECIES: hypothetical protein [Streptomyces]|uniref:Uncharacterized protein n=1 Tax=Streptomyces abikoensis TaxID=97398 RepID=A0ABW7TD98_9ACTN|nr:hypothetical protein [Streptomyces sp. UNOB3_S3]MCC3776640.1 hypothetical protein [Streptomyces sp. UNOB3_S3]
MPSPPVVIVPMTVDGLLVNAEVANDPFWRLPLAFTSDYKDPEPRPTDAVEFGKKPEQQGVYLHWHLPEALGKGRIDLTTGPDAALRYPTVPNRWLILRHYHRDKQPVTESPQVNGWLVYSDYLSAKSRKKGGGTSKVGRKQQWMGCNRSLTTSGSWSEPGDQRVAPLTALGPGLPAFAAFQPYCEDVFSFHDPLADATGKPAALDNGNLSYLVAGWHTAADDDPVAARQIDDLLAFFCDSTTTGRAEQALRRLGWSISPAPAFAGQDRSLYAGTLLGLTWDKARKPWPDERPDGHQDIKVAIGHDMADAMAALVKDSLPAQPGNGIGHSATAPFHAFHAGHLSTLEKAVGAAYEPDVLEAATHHDWFTPSPDGTWWKLTRTETAAPLSPDDEGAGISHDPGLLAKLAALNTAQRTLDHQQYEVAVLRRKVTDLWWLVHLHAEAETPPAFDTDKAKQHIDPGKDGPAKDLEAALAALPALRTARDTARAKLQAALPTGWKLTSGPHEPFYAPTDPTLLMRGAGTPVSDSLARETPLPCRYADQPVTTASVTAKGTSPARTFTAPANEQLPLPTHWDNAVASAPEAARTALKNLARELWVLHHASHYLQQARHLTTGKRLAEQERLAKPLPATWPAADTVWQQPWRPLTLAWQITCQVLPFDTGGQQTWRFDGSRRHLKGDTAAVAQFDLQGRSLISAVPTTTLQRRIDAHCATYPYDAPAEAFAAFRKLAGTWNLASQKLTGLRAALTHRTVGFLTSTAAPLPDRLKPANPLVPDPSRGAYQPVQAAHVRLGRLHVVDTFGRGVLVVHEGTEQNYRVRRSESLISRHAVTGEQNTHRYVELAPRLVQPARLCLTPLSHTAAVGDLDKPIDTDSDPMLTKDTPVGGWLVARRTGPGGHPAEHWALAVYGPAGRPLGEVRFLSGPAEDGSRDAVTWIPLPGSPYLTPQSLRSPAFTTAHPVLAGFLHALVDEDPDAIAGGTKPATERPFRMTDLAQSVEAGLLSTTRRPGSATLGASLAAGRPLALVRLRVHLELDGPPLTDPAWNNAFKTPTDNDPRYISRRWPVRLGAGGDRTDGLIGYYTGPLASPGATSYTTFHAVHCPPEPACDYVVPVVAGEELAVAARPRTPRVAPGDAAYLTTLLDPHAHISAYTDIQPVARFRLPPQAVADHLGRLALAVRLGPALARVLPASTRPGITPVRPRLTLPTPDAAGLWGFTARARPPATEWEDYALAAASTEARLDVGPPDAHNGYLTWTTPPPTTPPPIEGEEGHRP